MRASASASANALRFPRHTTAGGSGTLKGMGFTFVTLWTFVGYMASAAIVGAALVAVERRFAWRPSPWPGVLLLFGVFACIDSYWLPLTYVADLACTIDVGVLNGPADVGPVRMPGLFAPDLWDAIAWVGQVVVATHVAQWLGGTGQPV